MYLPPRFINMEEKNYYQYTDYHLEPAGTRRLDLIIENINKHFKSTDKADIKILDYGCGNGNISMPVASLGYTTIGIDIDENSIRQAQKANQFKNLRYALGDLDLFQDSEKFNAIIASEVLEHFENPEQILQRLTQNLDKNGLIIITIPNGYCIEELIRRFLVKTKAGNFIRKILKKNILKEKAVQAEKSIESHLHYFSLREIRNLIKKNNLEIINEYNSTIYFRQAFYLFFRLFMKRGSKMFKALEKADNYLSEKLPADLGSGWIFVCLNKRFNL